MSTPEPVIYRPTPTDVARLLRARTKDSHGTELGDWSDDTRPTAEEVDGLIDEALGPVLAQLGRLEDPLWADLLGGARHLVTLGAACLVEKSYFPEQVNSERSAYAVYKVEYDDLLAAMVGSTGVLAGSRGGHYSMWTPSATVVGAWGAWSTWPEPENPANWPAAFDPPMSVIGDLPSSGWTPRPDPFELLRIGSVWPPSRSRATRR